MIGRGIPRLPLDGRPELRGVLLTLLAMALFGSMDGLSKFLVQRYEPAFVLWIRHLVAIPLVLLVLAPQRPMRAIVSKRPWLQLVRVAILVSEMGIVMFVFRVMPLADTHAILAATPLIVTALSVPFLGEPVGLRRWLAVLAGFLGMLVILRPGLTVIQPASLLALLCCFMFACYHILTRKVSRDDSSTTSFLWQTVVGAGLLTLVGPFFWSPIELAHVPAFLALGALGAGGHYCLTRALFLAPAVVVQPMTYSLLLWATLIGYVVFGDLPDLWTIIGAAIIVAAGIYTVWREHVRKASGGV